MTRARITREAAPLLLAAAVALAATLLMCAGCARDAAPPADGVALAPDIPPEDAPTPPEHTPEPIVHQEGLADVTESGKQVLAAVCEEGDRMRAIVQEGGRLQTYFDIYDPFTLSWHRKDIAPDGETAFTPGRVTTLSTLIEACGEPDETTEGPATDRDGPARERIVNTHWWGGSVGVGVDANGDILEVAVSATIAKDEEPTAPTNAPSPQHGGSDLN